MELDELGSEEDMGGEREENHDQIYYTKTIIFN